MKGCLSNADHRHIQGELIEDFFGSHDETSLNFVVRSTITERIYCFTLIEIKLKKTTKSKKYCYYSNDCHPDYSTDKCRVD